MKNLLLSAAIGDICGSAYEFNPNKNYYEIDLLHPRAEFTDDTLCTFACAEVLLNDNLDMTRNLWQRCREDYSRGYGGMFYRWLQSDDPQPYNSFGNGSAMRCSAAGWLAKSEEECIDMATRTAMPTHNHPEGIKGAVATALTIFYLKQGHDKAFVQEHVLAKFYPEWAELSYEDIKPSYRFDETCQRTVPAAIICFLASKDFADCLKLNIALGGDADTLGAISAPMAYAFYKQMPAELVELAFSKLPQWMLNVSAALDAAVEQGTTEQPKKRQYTPSRIVSLNEGEIFVFGSNLQGMHGGGAARIAYDKFGAVWGKGVGLFGQTYAIPTMHGGTDAIRPYVDEFITFAKAHPELTFLVTRIGCGIAGFKDEDMAPLFAEALNLDNVRLPRSFVTHLI